MSGSANGIPKSPGAFHMHDAVTESSMIHYKKYLIDNNDGFLR
jgi:hypothetical protein